MALLPAIEAGSVRTTLEITLATLQGTAAVQVSAQAQSKQSAPISARNRCSTMRRCIRCAVCSCTGSASCCGCGENWTRQTSCRALRRPFAATADHTALFCACLVHGMVEHARGRPRWRASGSKRASTKPRASTKARHVRCSLQIRPFLPSACSQLTYCTSDSSSKGARLREAHARARALRQPGPQLAVLWFEVEFEVRIGNPNAWQKFLSSC